MNIKKYRKCPKCKGTGYVEAHAFTGGDCYSCGATGRIATADGILPEAIADWEKRLPRIMVLIEEARANAAKRPTSGLYKRQLNRYIKRYEKIERELEALKAYAASEDRITKKRLLEISPEAASIR